LSDGRRHTGAIVVNRDGYRRNRRAPYGYRARATRTSFPRPRNRLWQRKPKIPRVTRGSVSSPQINTPYTAKRFVGSNRYDGPTGSRRLRAYGGKAYVSCTSRGHIAVPRTRPFVFENNNNNNAHLFQRTNKTHVYRCDFEPVDRERSRCVTQKRGSAVPRTKRLFV